jgi:hypothetical protein
MNSKECRPDPGLDHVFIGFCWPNYRGSFDGYLRLLSALGQRKLRNYWALLKVSGLHPFRPRDQD